MYQYPENIFEAIRNERTDFLNNYIEIVPGYNFNQYKTIQKIHKYYNSRYDMGDYETIDGVTRKKVFYNINKWRADVATKMIDLDTKDLTLVSENPATDYQVFLLSKELKAWLKRNKMGAILNEISRKAPVYGSVVLEKTRDGARLIDLRYLFNDQGADNLKSARYVIIKDLMSAQAMRKMTAWDNVNEAIEKYCGHTAAQSYENAGTIQTKQGTPECEVFTRYAEVPLSWFTNRQSDKNTFTLSRFIVCGVDDVLYNDKNEPYYNDGIILFKEQIKSLPLKEFHYNKTEGRWLGIGVVEDTFEDQRIVNKLKDQEDKSQELASLILFQTKDNLITKNLLSDVSNGDVLRVGSEITPVDNQNKNLGESQNMAKDYDNHADRMTFSFDTVRGETAPSSATATAVVNALQQATSVFDFKRENYGNFVNEYIMDLVMPQLEKEINQPHIFRFAGSPEEMEKIRGRIADGYLREKMLETGDVLDTLQYQAAKGHILNAFKKLGRKLWVEINKDFFKNLDYEVTLEITGETKNVQTQLTNLSVILGSLAKNPGVLANPVLRKLLFKQMSLMGMSVTELEDAEQSLDQQAQPVNQPNNGTPPASPFPPEVLNGGQPIQ